MLRGDGLRAAVRAPSAARLMRQRECSHCQAAPVLTERNLDGPCLLVGPKLGEYRAEACHCGQTPYRSTTLHAGDHHEMPFCFGVKTHVLPPGEMR